jgi:hypothetical protein
LIKSSSEEPMWSDRFERECRDLLSLQNEIVGTLAREIQLQLTAEEQRKLQSSQTIDGDAYEAYLKGQFESLKQTPEALDKAERYFHTALGKEPVFGGAYAGLALVWLIRGDAGSGHPARVFQGGWNWPKRPLNLSPHQQTSES